MRLIRAVLVVGLVCLAVSPGQAAAYWGLATAWGPPSDAGFGAVAAARDDVVFVASGSRIYRYRPDGQLESSWPVRQANPTLPVGPGAIAVDGAGSVAVAQGQSVVRYDRDGRELTSWPATNPLAIAPLVEGTYAVSLGVDFTQNNVAIFRPDGTFLRSWRSGIRMEELAADPKGNLYSAVGRGRGLVGYLVKYSSDGRRLSAWGRWKGSTPGRFGVDGPRGVTFTDGLVWAGDPANRRIQAFTPGGQVVRICDLPSARSSGPGVELASSGTGYLYASEPVRLSVFSAVLGAPSSSCRDVPRSPLSLLRARVTPHFAPASSRSDLSSGGRLLFAVTEPATVRVLILRDTGRRLVSRTVTQIQADGGDNEIHFPGWAKRRPLAPGRYVARLTARSGGRRSATATARFTILRD